MLRAAVIRSVGKCGKCGIGVHQSVRFQMTDPTLAPKPKSLIRKLIYATGFVAAATGGVVGYAYFDPSFRAKAEEFVPLSKELFRLALDFRSGDRSLLKDSPFPHFQEAVEKVLPRRKTSAKEQPAVLEVATLPPLPQSAEGSAIIEPVDIKAVPSKVTPVSTVSAEEHAKKNKELEESLKAALSSATNKVRAATQAKMLTIAAVDEHTKLLKKTVDEKGDFGLVTGALERVEKASRKDAVEEADARNYLDSLYQVIEMGHRSDATHDNPLLTNAKETGNKLGQQLDEMNVSVQRARNEGVILNQYKDLVDKSRRQFALELKSILPNIGIRADESKLTEDDLNALLAHAHLKIDQLQNQLTDQQLHEEQHITDALESQRRSDAQLADQQTKLETKRILEQAEVDFERKLAEHRRLWELEMEEIHRKAAAAHSDHITQVLRTQRQLHEIETNQKVEEAVAHERSLHTTQMEISQGKLEGIETALGSRVAADVEIRRSKQFWVACQNLVSSVVFGRKGGSDAEGRRKPLAQELQIIKEASCDDKFVLTLIDGLSNESIYHGVYTSQDLKNRFYQLYKSSRRVYKVGDNGGGILRYASSYVQNAISLDLPRKFSSDDKIDPDALDTCEILARAKFYVDRDDLSSAVKLMQLLRGEPGRLARDWICDTRAHIETLLIAGLLVEHAAVSGIRAIY